MENKLDNKKRNEKILQATCTMLQNMNLDVENIAVEDVVDTSEDQSVDQVLVSVKVGNPAVLIGFRGKNLAAIQLVLSLIVKNELGDWVRVLLDVNGYRSEQKNRLESMTRALADKVVATGNPVAMASMSSFERRICHMAIADREDLVAESEGEGEDRHIVIKLKA
jgi:spoIIIJ-associated protein